MHSGEGAYVWFLLESSWKWIKDVKFISLKFLYYFGLEQHSNDFIFHAIDIKVCIMKNSKYYANLGVNPMKNWRHYISVSQFLCTMLNLNESPCTANCQMNLRIITCREKNFLW